MNQETQHSSESRYFLWISLVLLLSVFLADILLPLGIYGGVPYVILMIVVLWLLSPAQLIMYAWGSGCLAILGFFFAPELSTNLEWFVTRLMAAFAIGAMTLLIRRQAVMEGALHEKQKTLEDVVEKRTEGLKQVVDQLDEYKIRLAEAEQQGQFGFWEFYPNSQQMVWTNGMFAVYGFPITPQAPSIQEFLDRCHTDDLPTVQQAMQFGIAERRTFDIEYRIVMHDGSIKWLLNRTQPVVDKNGRLEMLSGVVQDITDRKQGDTEVELNRSRFMALFRNSAGAKALIIPNKRIIEVNGALCRWLGYRREELLKRPLEQLIHESDRAMDGAYVREIMSGERTVFQAEKRFIHKDGRELWGLYSVSAVYNIDGSVNSFAAEIVDIDDAKRMGENVGRSQTGIQKAEELLREYRAAQSAAEEERDKALASLANSEKKRVKLAEKLAILESDEGQAVQPMVDEPAAPVESAGASAEDIRGLIRLSDAPWFVMNAEGVFQTVNGAFEQTTGFYEEELEESSLFDFIYPKDKFSTEDAIEQALNNGSSDLFVVRHLCEDRSYKSLSLRLGAFGKPAMLYGVVQVDQQGSEGEDGESQIDLLDLADKMPFLIWTQDREGRCTFANQKVQDYTSLELDELTGEGWKENIHPDDLEHYLALDGESRETEEPLEIVFRYRRADGQYRWLQETRWPGPIRRGVMQGSLSFCIDITTLKVVEEAFVNMLEEVVDMADMEPALRKGQQEQIWSVVADNVKMADALISNASQLTHPDLSESMGRSGEQLMHLLFNILRFETGDTEALELMEQKVALQRAIERIAKMLNHEADDRNVEVEIKKTSSKLLVAGDKILLQRALESVLRNAISLSDSGQVVIEILEEELKGVVCFSQMGSRLQPGFFQDLRHFFDEEASEDSISIQEGGLELLLAARLFSLMKGKLEVIEGLDGPELQVTIGLYGVTPPPEEPEVEEKQEESAVELKESEPIEEEPAHIAEAPPAAEVETEPVPEEPAELEIQSMHLDVELDDDDDAFAKAVAQLEQSEADLKDSVPSTDEAPKQDKPVAKEPEAIEKPLWEDVGEEVIEAAEPSEEEGTEPLPAVREESKTPAEDEVEGDTVELTHDQVEAGAQDADEAEGESGDGTLTMLPNFIMDAISAEDDESFIDSMTSEGSDMPANGKHERDAESSWVGNGQGGYAVDAEGRGDVDPDNRYRVLIGEENEETQRLLRSLLQSHYDLTLISDTEQLMDEADRRPYDLVLLDMRIPGQRTPDSVLSELKARPAYYRTPIIAVKGGSVSQHERRKLEQQGFTEVLSKPYSIIQLLETIERLIEV